MTTFIGYELTELHFYHLSFGGLPLRLGAEKIWENHVKNSPDRVLNCPATHPAV